MSYRFFLVSVDLFKLPCFIRWRAPANYRGRSEAQMAPVGFLDGDFLESFLDYPAGSQEVERVMKGRNEAEKLNTTYGELRSILESLRSTHE